MKKWLLIFALLAAAPIARGQLSSFGDIPVEINAENTRFVGGVAIAEENVVIAYGGTTIYCDYAQYNADTRDVLVTGNVRIYREGRTFLGERAVYNLETKQLRASDFSGDFAPFRFAAETIATLSGQNFEARDAIFTTSDSAKPDYHLRAKRVRIYPNDRVVFTNVTLYVGRVPVFWYPYLYQSLKENQSFTYTPGYTSVWGTFLLTHYIFPINENMTGEVRLDYRSLRGVAGGFESQFKYGEDNRSWGRFRSYLADDSQPQTNETGLSREPVDAQRYRVTFQHRLYVTDDIYANIDINKLSDAKIMQDFFPSEFRLDPQPDNVISLTKWSENFTLTGIVRKQLNDFFGATERVPEIALDIKRHALFDSPIFYEGETSVSRLKRVFGTGSVFQDYDAVRADTFHQLLYPQTYFGWLSVVPRIGIRGTYYSRTGSFSEVTTEEEIDSMRVGGEPTLRKSVAQVLTTGGSEFRPIFNAGIESSFKFSRAYESVQSRLWGLDGLRHVVQPYTNLSYVLAGSDPKDILQFDRLNPSTQLPPLDFPQFTSTDSIPNWTIWRFGVRNRLQTRRDNRTFEWLSLDTFLDVNLQEPEYPGTSFQQGTFSNVFNRLRFDPVPWVRLTIDSQLPLGNSGFTEINTNLSLLANANTRIDFGHRYISGNPLFEDSSLFTFGGYYQVTDNWAFSVREQYELQDGILESQRYEVHRDLSSWIASLGLIMRNNRGANELGVLLTFTLKDLPAVNIPIGLDPDGFGGGGTGKNK